MKFRNFLFLVLATGMPFFLYYIIPRLIKITTVECYSQYGPCSPRLSQVIRIDQVINYASAKKLYSQKLRQITIVEEYTLRYKFPSTLEIYTIELKPIYGLKSMLEQGIANISGKGLVLSYADETNLPILAINTQLPDEGTYLEDDTRNAMEILFSVTQLYKVNTASLNDDNIEILLDNGTSLIFPLDKDRKYLIGSMVLIMDELERMKEENEKDVGGLVKTVDLRFENPVIKY
ncbi:MAG: hypothetical protein US60_C0004G0007 [Microgenomates group bacterium GW2011_GWC1_37_8]|uniref:POTRA domain-containing protein n=1 Tax=Candidatus Woesebacteria bacterium GW2011_GWB1_38_8 TaxID=1618570 RepID=A0A0G0L3Y8_9BACT|nr:MAG: hypothetical protein US60_C0004G0007 [Microgenomates group bacterium GW2011_GWC1_37_8]KKQ85727.1 MAG: hypothetical protein UT08_C0004G0039 [Candidatus Woesebacteria bacterium GW2011_GWB1_38_8]